MPQIKSVRRHHDKSGVPARARGVVAAVAVLFVIAMAAAAAFGLAVAHGDIELGLAAGIVCALGSAFPFLLLRDLMSPPQPVPSDGLTRADWAHVERAVIRFARGPGRSPVQRLELFRFRRPGRPALVVLVRLDRDGNPLAISTFDVELQKERQPRAAHGWRSFLPSGSRP